jgi:hypothetical protein
VRRLVVTMASCSEQVDRSPLQMSSTHRLFSTPVVLDGDSEYCNASDAGWLGSSNVDSVADPSVVDYTNMR